MTNQEFIDKIENCNFGEHHLHICDDGSIEIENWTDGGVNQIIYLAVEDGSFLEQYKDRIYGFDIDDEIDTMRQDKRYKQDFTYRESVEDYEAWVEDEKEFIAWLEDTEYLPTKLVSESDSYIEALESAIEKWNAAVEMEDKQETILAIGEIGYKIYKMNQRLEVGNMK